MASAIELASFKAQNIPGDVRFLLDSNLKLANWKVPTDVGNECQGKLSLGRHLEAIYITLSGIVAM